MRPQPHLIDNETTFGENADGLYLVHHQDITQDLIDTLHSERMAKTHVRCGEMDRVASVPTAVWELWLRQGRDPDNATARQIVQWLRDDNLHAFIATPKRV